MKFRARLAELRARIGKRITTVLPGQTGEIAASMTVGQTAGIDETSMNYFRGSGLAHIYSISGEHMSLVAGGVFWFLRFAARAVSVYRVALSRAHNCRRARR